MQVENDYDKDVYNGDLGFVRAVDAEAGEVLVEFDGREVAYGFGELDELVLAYATTIHKSQGSEYPAVVIPLTTQHYPMLRRNLLYTGVTRGRRLVVIVGQRRAIGIAVRGGQSLRRWSKLKEWLALAATPPAQRRRQAERKGKGRRSAANAPTADPKVRWSGIGDVGPDRTNHGPDKLAAWSTNGFSRTGRTGC